MEEKIAKVNKLMEDIASIVEDNRNSKIEDKFFEGIYVGMLMALDELGINLEDK